MDGSGDKELTRSELEALYLELEVPLFNTVYRWLWEREEALDVVQETFLRIWRSRDRVERETLRPLCYKIALNLASNRLRAKRIWKWVSLGAVSGRRAGDPHGEEELARRQEIDMTRAVVERLPEKLKRVVMLCEFSGMTYEEVGRTIGISPGTVGSRRNRALELMRKDLESMIGRKGR